MGTISQRIEEELLTEMDEKVDRERQRQRLQAASRKVRQESIRVNREFAEIEDAPDARTRRDLAGPGGSSPAGSA